MKIEIREEGGCELYKLYVDGKLFSDVFDGLIIDTEDPKNNKISLATNEEKEACQ